MVRIVTVSSSATATAEAAGNVIVSGSYGGEYNAYHAAKWGIRGVVLNDAGIGHGGAGIKGLAYLDRIGARAELSGPPTTEFPFVDLASGERWNLRPNPGPFPWWLLVAGRRVPGTTPRHYLQGWRLSRASTEATVTDEAGAVIARSAREKTLLLRVKHPDSISDREFHGLEVADER